MKSGALDVYACPRCHGRLRLRREGSSREILDGDLICVACSSSYPITGGIPRFVTGQHYADSFATQWRWFRTVQIDSMNGSSISDAALRATTGWQDDEYRGRRVLDAGVGAGRFAERAAAKGAQVFGVDVTRAVDVAYRMSPDDLSGAQLRLHDAVSLARQSAYLIPQTSRRRVQPWRSGRALTRIRATLQPVFRPRQILSERRLRLVSLDRALKDAGTNTDDLNK